MCALCLGKCNVLICQSCSLPLFFRVLQGQTGGKEIGRQLFDQMGCGSANRELPVSKAEGLERYWPHYKTTIPCTLGCLLLHSLMSMHKNLDSKVRIL